MFEKFTQRTTPAIAFLLSISAIGFTYLALNEYLPVTPSPIVSFPFIIVMLGYFAGGIIDFDINRSFLIMIE